MMKDRLLYIIFLMFYYFIRLMPQRMGRYLGILLGNCFYLLLKTRREIAEKNLSLAFGDDLSHRAIRELCKKVFQHLGLLIVEIVLLYQLNKDTLPQHISIQGEEKLKKAFAQKKGIIIYSAHLGNWEWMASAIALLGYPLYVVVTRQKNRHFDSFINDVRRGKGWHIVFKDFSLKQSFKVLKNGQCLGLLSDQHGGRHGWQIDFFGKKTSTFTGAVKLAQRTGAFIVPSFMVRKGWIKHHLIFKEPLQVPKEASQIELQKILEDLTKQTEDMIREHPNQWLWLHRRWKRSSFKGEEL